MFSISSTAGQLLIPREGYAYKDLGTVALVFQPQLHGTPFSKTYMIPLLSFVKFVEYVEDMLSFRS